MNLSKAIFPVAVALMLFACNSDGNDPNPSVIKRYASLSILSGDGQSAAMSTKLADSLTLKVNTDHKELDLSRFYLKSKLLEGTGNILTGGWSDVVRPNTKGKFSTAWQLGCSINTTQSVRFYLYYEDSCSSGRIYPVCTPIDSVTFTATATRKTSGWVKICGIDYTDWYNTKMREYGNEIYASTSGKIFKLKGGEQKYWQELSNVPYEVYDFGFNSSGKLYILTSQNGIFVTEDQSTWQSYGTGILDPRYPMSLMVEDSVVYASFMFDGLYRIRQSSSFAQKLLINGSYHEEYSFPVRHPNGDLYLVDKWDGYWKSSDSGDSWTLVPIDYPNVNYETQDFKIDHSGTLYIGSGDASLAILSSDTYTGTLRTYYKWNSSAQYIKNIQFDGDDVYYLVSFTPDPGVYSSTSSWQKIDLGFDQTIQSFYRMPDGKFLLASNDGIYYKLN